MTIGHRIFLLIFAPALLVVGLFAWLMSERYAAMAQSAEMIRSESAISAIDEFVGELQRERGRSAQFLAAAGVALPDALVKQREGSDRALATLNDALAANSRYDAAIGKSTGDALATTNRLGALRAEVAERKIDGATSTTRYSEIVAALLRANQRLTRGLVGAATKNDALALVMIEIAGERAGQARAVGASGLAKGAFTLPQTERLFSLGEEEREAAELFSVFAPESARAALDAAIRKSRPPRPIRPCTARRWRPRRASRSRTSPPTPGSRRRPSASTPSPRRGETSCKSC